MSLDGIVKGIYKWYRGNRELLAPSRAERLLRPELLTPAAEDGVVARYALVNPNWDFAGSTYFGCRDPHTPLELLFAAQKIARRTAIRRW